MHDEDNPKDLVDKVASESLHFGSHRRSEILQIETKDVPLDKIDEVDVNFPHPTKRHAEGFSHKAPGCAKSTFRKHTAQFSEKVDKKSRFLKSMSSKSGVRHQNYGVSNASKLAKRMAVWLGKDASKCTAHSFRRSAATSLENEVSSTVSFHDGR